LGTGLSSVSTPLSVGPLPPLAACILSGSVDVLWVEAVSSMGDVAVCIWCMGGGDGDQGMGSAASSSPSEERLTGEHWLKVVGSDL